MTDINQTNVTYILHIEDDSGITKMFQRAVTRTVKNAVVVSVPSGEEATMVAQKHPWAAVVSDWNLTGPMTGGDAYYQIRSACPALARRYVFLSDDASAADLCEKEGLMFVEKPAPVSAILDALDEAMGRITMVTA